LRRISGFTIKIITNSKLGTAIKTIGHRFDSRDWGTKIIAVSNPIMAPPKCAS
jgi:hypothetical protein